MLGVGMAWRRGQSYSEDLRGRVLAAVDSGPAARSAAAVFRVSVSYIYKALTNPAAADRGGERQRTARSPAPQTDTGEGSRPGGAHHGPPGPHPGGFANLALGRARGLVEQRGDVVGRRAPRAVV